MPEMFSSRSARRASARSSARDRPIGSAPAGGQRPAPVEAEALHGRAHVADRLGVQRVAARDRLEEVHVAAQPAQPEQVLQHGPGCATLPRRRCDHACDDDCRSAHRHLCARGAMAETIIVAGSLAQRPGTAGTPGSSSSTCSASGGSAGTCSSSTGSTPACASTPAGRPRRSAPSANLRYLAAVMERLRPRRALVAALDGGARSRRRAARERARARRAARRCCST